jgi:hypothetical protein
MRELWQCFRLRRDERVMMLVVVIAIVLLQVLMVQEFFSLFVHYDEAHWQLFSRNFHLSGYDPYSYIVVSSWCQQFDMLRHPLLAVLLFPAYAINQLLWWLTGVNCCQLVVSVLLTFCASYAFLFLQRTIRFGVGTGRGDATLLTAFFFGFAMILVAIISPDHFCFSLFFLTLTLWLSAKKQRAGEPFTLPQAALLFTLTAGVTLTNGVAVFLMVLITNGPSCLRPRYLLRAFVVPGLALLAFVIGWKACAGDFLLGFHSTEANQTRWLATHLGRLDAVVENIFGETIQLHRKYILGDVLIHRPMLVRYSWWWQYVVEAVIVALFVAGGVAGRRSRLLWTVLAVMAFNLLLHVGLGFALDEVHIMACHWAFAVPVAIGFLFRREATEGRLRRWLLRLLVLALTLYLWSYHLYLLYRYLTWPLAK